MSDQDLEGLLDELRTAVTDTAGLADDDRTRLSGIIGRIEDAVEEERHGVLDQIEDAVHRFETEHVTVVDVLNRIANALSAGGI